MKLFNKNTKINWKYAIGEIVLIFIGITLAISFDTYKENRKKLKTEIILLSELHENGEENIIDLTANLGNYEKANEACDYILNHLNNPSQPGDTLLGHYFKHLTIVPTVLFIKSAYNSIESRGWQIISNDSIRKTTMYVYDNLYFEIEQIVHERDLPFTFNVMMPIYFRIIDGQSKQPYDSNALRMDRVLQNQIIGIKSKCVSGIKMWNNSIYWSNKLQNMLRAEIKRLE